MIKVKQDVSCYIWDDGVLNEQDFGRKFVLLARLIYKVLCITDLTEKSGPGMTLQGECSGVMKGSSMLHER